MALALKIAVLGVLLVINVPVYRRAFSLCFGDMEELQECLGYLYRLDLASFFRGEFHHDMYAEFKVLLFLAICGGAVAIEYYIVLMALELLGVLP